jgi:hypothetical protein
VHALREQELSRASQVPARSSGDFGTGPLTRDTAEA